ncbi:MAG: hypothetical protein IT435_16780 [Phycisphaerales bacterium]|nr:hypothetical protein [Phycisphaerales bacterium]
MDATPATPNESPAPHKAAVVVDPGWLFVLAGLGLIGCSLLIPAADDLADARYLRDRAVAIEAHRVERLTRYEEFLEGLHARDQTLALSLAASQLNQIPADRSPLPVMESVSVRPVAGSGMGDDSPGLTDASVFPALEPPAQRLPERTRAGSILERLVLSPKTGIWVGLTGSICVLIGLLPRARR